MSEPKTSAIVKRKAILVGGTFGKIYVITILSQNSVSDIEGGT
jgi:hypothetical protein